MEWFKGWFGSEEKARGLQSVIVPLGDSGVVAHVTRHDVERPEKTIPCWSYVTDGLTAFGQNEIVFTLRIKSDELASPYPEIPLRILESIGGLARQGRIVGIGEYSEFGQRAPYGRHLMYVRAIPLAGVVLPENALHAVLITTEELEGLKEFGTTRLMARLGRDVRSYPAPPWSDTERPGLSFGAIREQTILSRFPLLRPLGVSALHHSGKLTIRLPRRIQPLLAETLSTVPMSSGVVVLTELDPHANGCYVWEPGQAEPCVIAPAGSPGDTVSCCFVALTPAVENEFEELVVAEDGVCAPFSGDAWEAIRRALAEGTEATVTSVGGHTVAFRWVHDLTQQADERVQS